MAQLPAQVERFLGGRRFAVAGVSRRKNEAANAIYRKLAAAGYEVVPVNPKATEVEGARCYPDLDSIPGALDGVVVATPPAAGVEVVRQAAARGVPRVWFHRSFGDGSVAEPAVAAAREAGLDCVVGGCPLMYVSPVDPVHRCMRWWLGRQGKVPR